MPPSPPARRPRTLRQPRRLPVPDTGSALSARGPQRRRHQAGTAPGPLGAAPGPGRREAPAAPVPSPLRQVSANCAAGRPRAAPGPTPAPSAASPQIPPFSPRGKPRKRGGPGAAWGTSGPASPPPPGPGPGPTCEPQEDDPSQDVPIHLSQRCGRRQRRGGGPARARAAPPAEPAGLAGRPRRVLRSSPGPLPGAAPAALRARAGGGGQGRGTRLPETASLPALSPSLPPAKARLGCLVPLLGPRAPGTFPCKSPSPRHPPLSGAITTSLVSAEKCPRRSSVLPKLAKWIPREMSVDDSCSKFPWGFHFQHEHSN